MTGNKSKSRKRLIFAGLFAVLFLIEVWIALFVHDQIVRPYLGDVLVVIVVYCFVRIFLPDGLRKLPLYVFLFAIFVEALQYLHLVELLGLENNTLARVILGSVFDWKDIGSYAVGCLLLAVFEFIRYGQEK